MSRMGNRTNSRTGKVNGNFYSLGGLQWYKYSLKLRGSAITTYREIHGAIEEGKDIYEYDKILKEWKKLDRKTGFFKKVSVKQAVKEDVE